MSVLVFAEHDNESLKDATLSAVTAAANLGGEVHVLVAGANARAAGARGCGRAPGCAGARGADDDDRRRAPAAGPDGRGRAPVP